MISKRIGKWSWALSAEERLAATMVEGAQRDKLRVAAPMKRRYNAMVEKEKKLRDRAPVKGDPSRMFGHPRTGPWL
jgi:hypothetical protein